MSRDEYERQFAAFNEDIKNHAVKVLRDDGLYRHLRCSRGNDYCMSFDLVTWPGHLCYVGDMGCFVFSRIADMFEFFRGRIEALIDRGYLAEKAVAVDKPDGLRVYSADLFRAAVKADYDIFAEELEEATRAELWQDIEDEVLCRADDDIHDAMRAAIDFTFHREHVFSDFWEHKLEEYTARFVWCCYAVPWAIERYDADRRLASPEVEAASERTRASDAVPVRSNV